MVHLVSLYSSGPAFLFSRELFSGSEFTQIWKTVTRVRWGDGILSNISYTANRYARKFYDSPLPHDTDDT